MMEGQIIDASFVEVPKQRNNKVENDQIKAGIIPDRFAEMMLLSPRKTAMHAGPRKITKAIMATKTISASITNIS